MMSISIRSAIESDIDAVCSVDLIARKKSSRREFIEKAVSSDTCYVACFSGEVIGYAVLNYNFHDQGFINMLYVHPDYQRRGAGTALVQELERRCKTAKLFTSTNLSNLPMQALLNRLGYTLTGVIHNLDEGDPEIVFFKRLN